MCVLYVEPSAFKELQEGKNKSSSPKHGLKEKKRKEKGHTSCQTST